MFAGERITGNSGPFTAEECWDMLSALVDRKYAPGVARVVKTRIHPLMFDALISFSYNVGLSALKHSTLLRRINSGRSDLAIREFKRWNKSGGSVRRGLTRRRKEEAAMFSLGYFYLTYGNDDWYDEKLILPQRPR
jgi:lysozyme